MRDDRGKQTHRSIGAKADLPRLAPQSVWDWWPKHLRMVRHLPNSTRRAFWACWITRVLLVLILPVMLSLNILTSIDGTLIVKYGGITGFLIIIATVFAQAWWGGTRIHAGLIRCKVRYRCPSCNYALGGLTLEPDGCTVCPECGSAWKLPESASKS